MTVHDRPGATYTATDPEGANVELTLSGDDKDMFELGDRLDRREGAGATQVLSFKMEARLRDAGRRRTRTTSTR